MLWKLLWRQGRLRGRRRGGARARQAGQRAAAEAAELLRATRLSHAVTYASCQGLTLQGRVAGTEVASNTGSSTPSGIIRTHRPQMSELLPRTRTTGGVGEPPMPLIRRGQEMPPPKWLPTSKAALVKPRPRPVEIKQMPQIKGGGPPKIQALWPDIPQEPNISASRILAMTPYCQGPPCKAMPPSSRSRCRSKA